jgi:hypothetical protein
MEWIKVADRLPKEGIYIVWGRDAEEKGNTIWRCETALFMPWRGWVDYDDKSMEVTHWMPLADAPEDAETIANSAHAYLLRNRERRLSNKGVDEI